MQLYPLHFLHTSPISILLPDRHPTAR
ncbi:unnamed protein product [Rhizoctonia solani]|uniref:Uncharacterized protein n=1 Tax=Rhizoctonia solani TaxID=456999 RepID=A0A8H3GPS6_9AGAM|nr:unnamed protein product [Rhizoctonia solani]